MSCAGKPLLVLRVGAAAPSRTYTPSSGISSPCTGFCSRRRSPSRCGRHAQPSSSGVSILRSPSFLLLPSIFLRCYETISVSDGCCFFFFFIT
ncbi:hypothetical protein RIF29_32877 [Crotalaria pallida]|uniref:Uncharacterized protein n=1 Tax=Crotalaria pallida TaxID=3830 RepID=A0AAN9E7R3_CROPI